MNHEIIADVHGTKLYDSRSRVQTRLKAHTKVEIIEENKTPFTAGTWTKVKTAEGKVGWVDADKVQRIA